MSNDECFDPYDMGMYMKPMQKQDEGTTSEQKSKSSPKIPSKEQKKTKRVFNPYEQQQPEESQEESEPLQNKQKKRKKTDEDLPQNIDLTKNAYQDNKNDSSNQNQDTSESNPNNEEEEEELPLLEELGIKPSHIIKKIMSVLTVHRIDKKFLQDSDMAGPFLIFLIFAFSLVLQAKTCFGYLYGISVFGSIMLFLLMNLMNSGKSILLYDTISVLGYCLIPVTALSFLSIFITMKGLVGAALCLFIIIISSISATRFFEIALEMAEQKWLIFYPVCLFYTCFVLVCIF